MRKLNKKGFTLIELLAVIVVLAIVLVVTIPSVLSSMGDAKQKQFENAVKSIEEYTRKQKEACNVADNTLAQYTSELFDNSCKFKAGTTSITVNGTTTTVRDYILKEAGYTFTATASCASDNSSTNTSDFCDVTINADGTVSAKSPAGSKFGFQSK